MDKTELSAVIAKVMKSVSKQDMTLSMAKQLAEKVMQKAAEIGVNIVVAVADQGANPVLVQRMDNAFIASYDIAVNKTYTCAALKMSTKQLAALAQPGKPLYGIQHTNQGKIVIFGGGEPLTQNGAVIGALGVSGGSEEQDTFLAAYGKSVFETEILNP